LAGGSLCPHAAKSNALNMTKAGIRINELQMARYLTKTQQTSLENGLTEKFGKGVTFVGVIH